MAWTSKDGHRFPSRSQQRLYEESEGNLWRPSLRDTATAQKSADDVANAPRGGHQGVTRAHGLAHKTTVEQDGNGRWRVTSWHRDGFSHTSVHPEYYRAKDVANELHGSEPPPGLATMGRARSQPTGPKEDERIRREDSREEER